MSIQNGLFDPTLLGSVFPKEQFIERYLPLLRSGHKSVFADRVADFPGQRFRSLFPQDRRELEPGGVIKIKRVRGGLSVVGWAVNIGRLGKNAVVFVDETGTIIGFGHRLRAGIPRDLIPRSAAPASQIWVGFINGRYRSTSFVPYLAEPANGSAFPIEHQIPIAAIAGAAPPP